MSSIAFELKTDSKQFVTVRLRVVQNRKILPRVKIFKVHERDLEIIRDEKGRIANVNVKKSNLKHAILNKQLRDKISEIELAGSQGTPLVVQPVEPVQPVAPPPMSLVPTVRDAFQMVMVDLDAGTTKGYRTTLMHLTDAGLADLAITDLDNLIVKVRYFKEYMYALEDGEGHKVGDGHVANQIKRVRATFNKMKTRFWKLKITNPCDYVEMPKVKDVYHEAVPLADIGKLVKSLREGEYTCKMQIVSVAAWLYSWACGGMRFSDLMQVEWDDIVGNVLNYKAGKNDVDRKIELDDLALHILNLMRGNGSRFVFGQLPENFYEVDPQPELEALLAVTTDKVERNKIQIENEKRNDERKFNKIGSVNAKLNAFIKDAAVVAKVENSKNIRFHLTRHSMTDEMSKAGASTYEIQHLLGDKNRGSVEHYLKVRKVFVSKTNRAKITGQVFTKDTALKVA